MKKFLVVLLVIGILAFAAVYFDLLPIEQYVGCIWSHDAVEWRVAEEPTCMKEGLEEQVCTDCGEVQDSRVIGKIPHTSGEWRVTVPATCVETGTKERRCISCDVLMESAYVPTIDHVAKNDWTVMEPATCTTDGTQVKYCQTCPLVMQTQEISAHHTEVVLPAVEASCKASGLTEGVKCSACDKVFVEQQIIPQKEHRYQTVAAVAPTCVSVGYTEGVQCVECREWKVKPTEIGLVAHSLVTNPGKDATCTTDGLTEGASCTACHMVILPQAKLPKLGHDFNIFSNTCSRCPEHEYPEIRSANELSEYYGKYDAIVYLDQCISVSETNVYWTLTLSPDTNYVRLVGTPGVQYNFRIVVDSARKQPVTIDLVNASIKTLIGAPIIESTSKADVEIGFYGTNCSIIGRDGGRGSNGQLIGGNDGKNGENGSVGVQVSGNLTITVAAGSCKITGGNGGDGGKGVNLNYPSSGGNGGNGGNGAYAIQANSITVKSLTGYSTSNLKLTGGSGGQKGSASGGIWPGGRGNDGKPGNSSSATNVQVLYK